MEEGEGGEVCCGVGEGGVGCCGVREGGVGCCGVREGGEGCCGVREGVEGCCGVREGGEGCCGVSGELVGLLSRLIYPLLRRASFLRLLLGAGPVGGASFLFPVGPKATG